MRNDGRHMIFAPVNGVYIYIMESIPYLHLMQPIYIYIDAINRGKYHMSTGFLISIYLFPSPSEGLNRERISRYDLSKFDSVLLCNKKSTLCEGLV